MSKHSRSLSIVFAAAMAAAGVAQAQLAETTNTPQRAGEASTMTGGAPNVAASNSTTTQRPTGVPATPAETTNVPQRAGEASTMTGGAPNSQTSNLPGTTTNKQTSGMGNTGSETAGKAAAAETTSTPQRPGEASTMTGGAPNVKTN